MCPQVQPKSMFLSVLKVWKDGHFLMDRGKTFHSWGPALLKSMVTPQANWRTLWRQLSCTGWSATAHSTRLDRNDRLDTGHESFRCSRSRLLLFRRGQSDDPLFHWVRYITGGEREVGSGSALIHYSHVWPPLRWEFTVKDNDAALVRHGRPLVPVGFHKLVEVLFLGVEIKCALDVSSLILIGISAVHDHVLLEDVIIPALQDVGHL